MVPSSIITRLRTATLDLQCCAAVQIFYVSEFKISLPLPGDRVGVRCPRHSSGGRWTEKINALSVSVGQRRWKGALQKSPAIFSCVPSTGAPASGPAHGGRRLISRRTGGGRSKPAMPFMEDAPSYKLRCHGVFGLERGSLFKAGVGKTRCSAVLSAAQNG